MLERCFALAGRGATVGSEVRGGLTTFMVMAITKGIGAGFVTHCFIKVVRGRGGEVRPMMYATAVAFVVYFGASLIEGLLR